MGKDKISKSVIKRLPRYYRFLSELEEQDVERVNSGKLAQIMRTTASQVRQDLNCFGG
ncbi:MAG: redox-sensing transcriptional repressor Rex, partial [Ruminococcus sp.]|nr:redox-sensing transcriptional repressor Rex [Ruminococcus sp.]